MVLVLGREGVIEGEQPEVRGNGRRGGEMGVVCNG